MDSQRSTGESSREFSCLGDSRSSGVLLQRSGWAYREDVFGPNAVDRSWMSRKVRLAEKEWIIQQTLLALLENEPGSL